MSMKDLFSTWTDEEIETAAYWVEGTIWTVCSVLFWAFACSLTAP